MKRWPAYLLACCTGLVLGLNVLLLGLLFWATPAFSTPMLGLFVALVVLVIIEVAALAVAMRLAFQMIRYPPRLSARGVRLWLFATSEYVLMPWPRVTAVRTEVTGLSRGLFVDVVDPEQVAVGGSKRAVKRVRRLCRRHGTPFVYALRSAPARLGEMDEHIRLFSGGRLALSTRGRAASGR